jgi:sugar lactone lactonase YvrE
LTRLLLLGALVTTAGVTAAVKPAGPYDVVAGPGGTLLVADGVGNRVLRYAPATRRYSVFAGTGIRVDSGDGKIALRASFAKPVDVERDAAGNVYVVTADGGHVRRIDAKTRRVRSLRLRTAAPVAIALTSRGVLYVTDGRAVWRAGVATPVVSGFDRAQGIAVSGGTLYVSDTERNRVVRVDLASGAMRVLAGLERPMHLTVGPDGNVYVALADARSVVRVDADGTVTVVATGLDVPFGVAFGADGALYATELFAKRLRRIVL